MKNKQGVKRRQSERKMITMKNVILVKNSARFFVVSAVVMAFLGQVNLSGQSTAKLATQIADSHKQIDQALNQVDPSVRNDIAQKMYLESDKRLTAANQNRSFSFVPNAEARLQCSAWYTGYSNCMAVTCCSGVFSCDDTFYGNCPSGI